MTDMSATSCDSLSMGISSRSFDIQKSHVGLNGQGTENPIMAKEVLVMTPSRNTLEAAPTQPITVLHRHRHIYLELDLSSVG